MRTVGIDVGAKELVLVLRQKGRSGEARTYDNTSEEHRKLIKYLKSKQKETLICMEATGVYHFDLAVIISKTPNLKLMVLNPKVANRFAQALAKKDKTDKVDAEVLALFAERMDFVQWTCPSDMKLAVRAYARQLAKLTRHQTAAKNQMHSLKATDFTPKKVLKSQRHQIKFCKKEIEELEKDAVALIKSDVEMKQHLELLLSVKGIAQTSAIQLLGELMVLPKDMTKRQWVAYAGLNPKKHQSGTSVNKKPRISKTGNRYLRKALFMPALSAANNDRRVRGFYLHLQNDNGLLKMQAVCAVMRKLLHAIWGMFENKQPFNNTKFYASEAKTIREEKR